MKYSYKIVRGPFKLSKLIYIDAEDAKVPISSTSKKPKFSMFYIRKGHDCLQRHLYLDL